MPVTYEITVSEGGATIVLGTIAFDEQNDSTLDLAGDGPLHRALRDHWAEISALKVLNVMRTERRQQEDGSWIRLNRAETIGRDSPDYPPAALHFLASNHDYLFAQVLEPTAD